MTSNTKTSEGTYVCPICNRVACDCNQAEIRRACPDCGAVPSLPHVGHVCTAHIPPDGRERFELDEKQRVDAHAALDRWLDECEREATAQWESGHGGYIGRIKLCAFVEDEGIELRAERSFTEAL